MRILLLEPDRVLAATYQQALQDSGHTVCLAATAQDAIFAADEALPDAIILELQLVSHSGIEFLYELRSYPEWQAVPVLVLSHVPPTEFGDSWELLHSELGVQAYLYKPQTSLVALVRAVHALKLPATAP